MQTSRLLLVIVGDLDPAMLKARIAASFGKLPRGDYKAQFPPQLSFTASTVEVTARELPTNYIQGMFTGAAAYFTGHLSHASGVFAVARPCV